MSVSLPSPRPSEVLREGDELLEVNGVPVTGRSTDEIIRIMVSGGGSMKLLAGCIDSVHRQGGKTSRE